MGFNDLTVPAAYGPQQFLTAAYQGFWSELHTAGQGSVGEVCNHGGLGCSMRSQAWARSSRLRPSGAGPEVPPTVALS